MNKTSFLAFCITALVIFVFPQASKAADEIKGKRIQSTSTVKTINPKALKNIKAVGKVKMLSNTEYQRKIKAHDLKMKSQAMGIKQQANTRLKLKPRKTQNHKYTKAQDCNDKDPAINPQAAEVCDGVDNNCDGDVDKIDDRRLTVAYYLDADSDSWGDTSRKIYMCPASEGAPAGYATNKGDCNDKAPTVYPGAYDEPNNGVDENCDGSK